MEYISHEGYKKMLGSFGKEGPKGKLLKEGRYNDEDAEFVEMISDELVKLFKAGKISNDQWNNADDYLNDNGYELWVDSQTGSDTLGTILQHVGASVEEGNAFTAGLAKTKKGGEFKVGDKEFKDRTNYDAPVKEYQFDQMYPDDPGPFEGLDARLKEFLAKEDDVNWEAVDDNEAEENETDNGIEEVGDKSVKESDPMGQQAAGNPDEEKGMRDSIVKREGINLPSSQATGQTIKERAGSLAHLTSEERDQLRQYVETIKTVKNEIKKMVGKQDMEEGGDTTGLVMKPTTMSEDDMEQGGDKHEEIEKALGAKHQIIHSAIDKIIQTVKDSGFSEGDAALFLQHEIEEKAKQYATSQYDSN